jgi:hypothetical protein
LIQKPIQPASFSQSTVNNGGQVIYFMKLNKSFCGVQGRGAGSPDLLKFALLSSTFYPRP